MDEIWKDIPGYDYSASSLGRVASRKYGKWRIKKLRIDKRGYVHVSVFFFGKTRDRLVHRLVAVTFLGPPPTPSHQVNHKDGVKGNNRSDNFEWVTPLGNQRHRLDVLGKWSRGETSGKSKLTEANVREIRIRFASGEKKNKIAFSFGVTPANIGAIISGKTWGWLT